MTLCKLIYKSQVEKLSTKANLIICNMETYTG